MVDSWGPKLSLTVQSAMAFTSSTCRWDLFYHSSFIISCWEFYVKLGMNSPANDKSKSPYLVSAQYRDQHMICVCLYCGLHTGKRMPELVVNKSEYQKASSWSNSMVNFHSCSARAAWLLPVLQQVLTNQGTAASQAPHSAMEASRLHPLIRLPSKLQQRH